VIGSPSASSATAGLPRPWKIWDATPTPARPCEPTDAFARSCATCAGYKDATYAEPKLAAPGRNLTRCLVYCSKRLMHASKRSGTGTESRRLLRVCLIRSDMRPEGALPSVLERPGAPSKKKLGVTCRNGVGGAALSRRQGKHAQKERLFFTQPRAASKVAAVLFFRLGR
jgi:hypothetical protein